MLNIRRQARRTVISMALPDGKWAPGIALFQMDASGNWKFASRLNQNERSVCIVARRKLALLQDTQAPRASPTKIDPSSLFVTRNLLRVVVCEEGSPDIMSVKTVIDGKDEEPIIDEKSEK
jgi:hypothetical protein